MLPIKPALFLVAVLGAGGALAFASLTLGIPTGWIGAAGLLGWALVVRRRWAAMETRTGMEPGGPERALWVRLAGVGLLLGHLVTALLRPDVDLHVGRGNSLAIDSWTMLAAYGLTIGIFARDSREQDERHAAVAALGVRAGYAALILMLIILLLYLGFAPRPLRALLTHWTLANLLVAILLASHVAMLMAQLAGYGRDTARRAADELST